MGLEARHRLGPEWSWCTRDVPPSYLRCSCASLSTLLRPPWMMRRARAVIGGVVLLHKCGFLIPFFVRVMSCLCCIPAAKAPRARASASDDRAGRVQRGTSTSVCIVYGGERPQVTDLPKLGPTPILDAPRGSGVGASPTTVPLKKQTV